MNKRLFVGGFPWATTDAELQEAFSKAGTVESVEIRKDPVTQKSKGYGFVEMATEAEAEAAIEMYHQKDFNGRPLTVDEAQPRRGEAGGNQQVGA